MDHVSRLSSLFFSFLQTRLVDWTGPALLHVLRYLTLLAPRTIRLPLLGKLGLAQFSFCFFLFQLGRSFVALLLPCSLGLVPLGGSHFTNGLLHPFHSGVGLELCPLKHLGIYWYQVKVVMR